MQVTLLLRLLRRRGNIDRFRHSPVAQLVEQLTVNQRVAGSSPAGGAFLFSTSAPTRSRSAEHTSKATHAQSATLVTDIQINLGNLQESARQKATIVAPGYEIVERSIRLPKLGF